MNNRRRSLNSGITISLILLFSLILSFLPAEVSATLADDIEAAFQDALMGMAGTELVMNSVTISFLGVEITVTPLGFALCEPADPYAAPIPTILPGISDYNCQNLTTIGADVAADETTASILIEVSKIFLDVETSRSETVACILDGDTFPYNGTVSEDGYMIGHASITVGLGLAFVDGCFRATLVPGSAAFNLTPDVMGSKDQCMNANMNSVVLPLLYPLIEDQLDIAFEAALALMMSDINDMLCFATPVDSRSWGSLKTAYR